jgi:hypothetical protein
MGRNFKQNREVHVFQKQRKITLKCCWEDHKSQVGKMAAETYAGGCVSSMVKMSMFES